MNWFTFAILTVLTWGLYGIALHQGQTLLADKTNGLFKSFLLVGIAYFITAVLAPLAVLVFRKANWNFPGPGIKWSLIAGILGAIGAFGVLLAFSAQGRPPVVMSIVFAGAPIVNAIASLIMHPPDEGLGSIKAPFYIGIILAAVGGCLVTLYKPKPPAPKHAVVAAAPANSR
jgi:hypothetical protein